MKNAAEMLIWQHRLPRQRAIKRRCLIHMGDCCDSTNHRSSGYDVRFVSKVRAVIERSRGCDEDICALDVDR